MHDARTHKPAARRRTLATATLRLAGGLMVLLAMPAAGQGAAPDSGSAHGASPVALSRDAVAPVRLHAQAALPTANAQDPAKEAGEAVEPQAPYYANVGGATRHLLALQRSGQIASPVPRPVPGEVVQRSRERYLKSFEREIPERFQSSVSQKSDSR